MADFKGFNPITNDYLIGIRFNNCKEWFHENKNIYQKNVHEPICLLADECFDFMKNMDSDFDEKPKISRANRDIRFSKNKNPYKESKWFFLRKDGKPDLIYEKPTYFFEISPDWYRYGFFYAPSPKGLCKFRKKVDADNYGLDKIIDYFNSQNIFKLYGNMYKKNFNKNLNEKLSNWYNRKSFEFTCYGSYEDEFFYESKLKDIVCNGFKILYPIYKYFNNI